MKQSSYTIHGRRNRWRENSLEGADENVSKKFDWYVIKKFGPYVGRYKGWTLASVALMLLYTVLNLANPFLIGVAIDQFIGHNDLRGLAITGIVLIIVNVLMWQAQYWQVWSMSWAGQQILYNLSSDMFTHLQSLSLSFYDRTQIGRVMSRLQSDIDVLESMLSSGLLSMLGSLVSLVGIIIAMLAMNITLALLSFTVLPIMFVIAAFWQRFAQRSFRRTRAAISVVNATLQENITGMRVIQSLAREERNRDEFDELNAYNRDTNLEASRIAALILPLVEVVAAMAIAITVLYGGVLVSQGSLKVGVLVAFTLYINRFFDPIREISQQYSQLQRAGVAAERIFQILETPVEIKDKPGAEELPQIHGEVEFRDVTFGYNRDLPVLRDFDLHMKAGQTVAIVGPTGAGKSTIAGLLARFYDIQQGSVLVDGHDVPEGYDTLIRERGRNLSVGQRQLISFARALLADPRILILDEATANIDTFTELLVQQALKRLLHGRTALVIAHRLSTIKGADSIVVLQGGRIVEQGTHAELLQRNGIYASLYAMGFRHT